MMMELGNAPIEQAQPRTLRSKPRSLVLGCSAMPAVKLPETTQSKPNRRQIPGFDITLIRFPFLG